MTDITQLYDEPPRVQLLHPDAKIPTRAHPTDAGLDFYAHNFTVKDVVANVPEFWVPPGKQITVGTGVAMAIPHGHVGLLFARSSIATNGGFSLTNGVGVIDSGYRGEIKAVMRNHTDVVRLLRIGERIAQLVIVPIQLRDPIVVDELEETVRGGGGFGSTGA